MCQDVAELPDCPRVIRVPRLCDEGVVSLKLPDEGEDTDAICDHGEGVPLGHALFSMQEVAWTIHGVPYHQCGPVAVAVECKLRATGKLVQDRPYYGCPVLLIERIPRVNKGKPQVFLKSVFFPKDAHHMNGALNPRLHPSRELCGSTGGLPLRPCHLQQAICHQYLPSLSHADRPDP